MEKHVVIVVDRAKKVFVYSLLEIPEVHSVNVLFGVGLFGVVAGCLLEQSR